MIQHQRNQAQRKEDERLRELGLEYERKREELAARERAVERRERELDAKVQKVREELEVAKAREAAVKSMVEHRPRVEKREFKVQVFPSSIVASMGKVGWPAAPGSRATPEHWKTNPQPQV